jgi:hypothetical protein
MVMVMADVHILEAQIQLQNLNQSDSTRKIAYSRYLYLFEKNKITPELFKKSFDFYSKHPVVMSDLYKEIITEISKRQAVATKK